MVERIYLIGFMGTGKSTVGKGVAARLGFTFLDMDQIIETRAGMTIPELFETYGESYFRELESNVLADIERDTIHAVIATGGGVVIRECNRQILSNGDSKRNRLIIHLTADVDTLVQRLMEDQTRPLLQGEELRARITRLQEERKGLYDFADLTIATDSFSVEEIIEQILQTVALR
jgi:shikimate kinase